MTKLSTQIIICNQTTALCRLSHRLLFIIYIKLKLTPFFSVPGVSLSLLTIPQYFALFFATPLLKRIGAKFRIVD